jgi:hypothetical protein
MRSVLVFVKVIMRPISAALRLEAYSIGPTIARDDRARIYKFFQWSIRLAFLFHRRSMLYIMIFKADQEKRSQMTVDHVYSVHAHRPKLKQHCSYTPQISI